MSGMFKSHLVGRCGMNKTKTNAKQICKTALRRHPGQAFCSCTGGNEPIFDHPSCMEETGEVESRPDRYLVEDESQCNTGNIWVLSA